MKPHYITSWKLWKELCEHYAHDPYKTPEFSLSKGGGNSTDFEYVGKIPKKEEDSDEAWKNARDAYCCMKEE